MAGKRETILMVDDERYNINVLIDLLDDYEILVAKNGEQALNRVRLKPLPDLILLDIMMPGMDGYQVCTRLKADAETRDIPVIFVTAMNETEDEAKGFLLGAVDYIVKPFSPTIVKARVKSYLALKNSMENEKILNQQLLSLNDQLVDKNNELLDLNELKNKFLGIAAHDLRNPLAGIMGMASLLLYKPADEVRRQHFLESIHITSKQMSTLLNDLLDVLMIESGKLKLNLNEFELTAILNDRVILANWTAKEKNIQIETHYEAQPVLLLDDARINQVIDNLLSNAIKFSERGTTIVISCGIDSQYAVVQVKDQGPGIPDHEHDQLFGTFQKTSVKPTGNERSTGLGLAIVKKIIEVHGGEIKVESKVGEGSTFIVKLPLKQQKISA